MTTIGQIMERAKQARSKKPSPSGGIAAYKAAACKKVERSGGEAKRSFRREGIELDFAEVQRMKRWG